jgi:ABC-type lipoprotein release transport system permease subunit
MDRLKMLTLLALRSMVSHRVKNAIVGIIMIVGTLLVVVGTSILDSVEQSMQEGITASATGHIQIFAKDAEDDLAIFGQMGTATDIGELTDFQKIDAALSKLPGVVDVVPMALGNAVSFGKSELDRVLLELRYQIEKGNPDGLDEQIRQIAAIMLQQNDNTRSISTDLERLDEERAIIEKVLSDEFWVGFDQYPGEKLEYLDTRFAPLSTEGKLLYLRYIATDPTQFSKSFGRFQIVDGEEIPEGKRGILFSKRFYEKQVKSRVAREFDAIIKEFRDGTRIATNEVLQNRVKRMSRAASSVVFQLDKIEVGALQQKMTGLDPAFTGSIEKRVTDFLTVTDKNIEERYAFFYEHVAPMIDVYDVTVGDEIVIQSFTKSGYAKAAKVKVWGTFNFRGLEGSDLAGAINVMDLITFRTLYGKMTPEQRKELDTIREEAGVDDISADNAEDALFGGDEELEVELSADPAEAEASTEEGPAADPDSLALEVDRGAFENQQRDEYDPAEIPRGIVLNAAVILEDSSRVEATLAAIKKLEKRESLGIQAIDWQKASGLVGQFILVISLVLYTAIVIIFTVALVIINNSMVMATMERIPEIGTIRAIGAQKSTIMLLTLLETTVLCMIAGTIGALLGAGTISLLGSYGIPAGSDVMVFLFGGPRLYPEFAASNLILGFVIILIVSVISTIYPALVATKVQPAVAMRAKE